MKFELPKIFQSKKPKVQNEPVSIKEIINGKEVYRPIMTCLIDSSKKVTEQEIEIIKTRGFNVNWKYSNRELEMYQLKNSGERTYVISRIDSEDKYSEAFVNCVGLVAVGENIITGKQISFMSHQNPISILGVNYREFEKDLADSLKELKMNSKEGSIDLILFGGNNYIIPMISKDIQSEENRVDYTMVIKRLGDIIEKNLGIDPLVITGPHIIGAISFNDGSARDTNVYFDNNQRRLFLLRPFISSGANEPYRASKLDEMVSKYELF
ncbi:MAG: hypothetical protein K9L98_02245 [Candidatus Pacebacteria bacterium]|nr:hypothetical protein [Candidatus Paceibacterota bacterium]MCF7862807.1 hypothetical protein [Candidatus Paceibacterota bacterium]